MTELPVLDAAAFLDDPNSAAAGVFSTNLTRACHEIGFAYLTGHGITAETNAEVHRVARDFFALDESKRNLIVNTNSPHFRGYTRLGMEHTNGLADWRDQIDLGPECAAVPIGPDDPAWLRLRGPNQWPADVPDMPRVMTRWMDEMSALGRALMGALAIGLGQRADVFDHAVWPDAEILVKVIRYPALDRSKSNQGLGAHHDSGLLSFIHQDEVGGLEVEVAGDWIGVDPLPGAYVLNLGEMLQLATSGYLKATRHRVKSPASGVERISVAYFFNPRMEATFEPIELPAEMRVRAAGGQNANPSDPVLSTYGDNWLKFRMRSHPDVAAIHHADLVAEARR